MVHIPEQVIEEIKRQSNILDTVSQYVELRKSGKNHFAHCPFHEDRTPSFSVSEDKQIFHCFSCGRGGDVFRFLREIEGYSFQEAVINQAQRIGYPLSDDFVARIDQDSRIDEDSEYGLLLKVHEKASKFYHHVLLNTRAGEKALNYLKRRGLTQETIETFQLGYSPKHQREALMAYLKNQIGSLDENKKILAQSGLFSDYAIEENDAYLDRFSGRIIFPLTNIQGQVVAFSGRVFDLDSDTEQTAKYLNSPETMIFNKRKLLYHLDQAKAVVRRENEVILFEGYMDVIAASQAGVSHGIASMGTSLTEEQLKQIDRYTDRIVLAYDGDGAGLEATKRAVDLIRDQTPFDLEVILFPKGEDPDSYIQNHGRDRFKDLITHGRETVMSFFMYYYRQQTNLDNERELLIYIDQILTELARVDSPVERELYLKQISENFDLSLESLKSQFQEIEVKMSQKRLEDLKDERQKIEANLQSRSIVPTSKRFMSRSEKAEQMLLHRLIYSDDAWDYVALKYGELKFIHPEYQLIYILYQDFKAKGQNSPDIFLNQLDSKTAGILSEIMMIDLGQEFTEQEIKDYIAEISKHYPLEKEIANRRSELEEAKRIGDDQKELELTIHITQLIKKREMADDDSVGG